jgi:hypothetical protein
MRVLVRVLVLVLVLVLLWVLHADAGAGFRGTRGTLAFRKDPPYG